MHRHHVRHGWHVGLWASRMLTLAAAVMGFGSAEGQVPNLVDFQGTLTNAQGAPVSGQRNVTFTLYTAATGGQQLWQETQALTVVDGLYATALGQALSFPDALWANAQLWLGVRVGAEAELTPRVRFVAVPYALRAKYAESAAGGGGGGGNLPSGAMVVSTSANDQALLSAGLVRYGSMATGKVVTGAGGPAWSLTSLDGAPEARSGHLTVWTGTEMVVWGGNGQNTPNLVSGGIYTPGTDSWRTMATLDAPQLDYMPGAASGPRVWAFWTGSHVLVWGRSVAAGVGGMKGGLYDPSRNEWTRMADWEPVDGQGMPVTIESAWPFWTGSSFVVWGLTPGPAQAAAVYEPGTNVWRTIAATGAPAAGDIVCWAGDRLVVIDLPMTGMQGQAVAAAYFPAQRQWQPVSTGGLPSFTVDPMSRPSSVWTGSRLVVWGTTGIGPVWQQTVAAYDPAGDHWVSASPPGAPAERVVLSTAKGVIVLGDEGAAAMTGSFRGGLYDANANTWTPFTDQNAPVLVTGMSGQLDSSVVWTGSALVAWGLRQGGNAWASNLGRVYDPETDTWAEMATSSAVSARSAHSTVWTGEKMIVWGGTVTGAATVPTNTGGMYDPTKDMHGLYLYRQP